MIGIYSITNKLNNKRYIGQSIARIKRHFRELRRGVHHCHHLQRAFDKSWITYNDKRNFQYIKKWKIIEFGNNIYQLLVA